MWMGAGSGDVHEEEVDENTSEEPGQARKGHETSTATAQQEPSAISELDYERYLHFILKSSGVGQMCFTRGGKKLHQEVFARTKSCFLFN